MVRRLYADGRTNIAFVGRIIPNKRIDDLIRTFALYQRHHQPHSRLLLVGDHRGHERYYDRLRELVASLGVQEVVFTGHVDHDELLAYYSVADAFLCLSEHEGFCVPLQEAMVFGVPVVAYDAGAVRETLRGRRCSSSPTAGWTRSRGSCTRSLTDAALRASVLATQQRALEALRAIDFGALLQERLPARAGRSRGVRVRVDQWVPALHRGDAIGDSARLMRDAFRRWGHTADVYALELDEDLQGDGRPWSDWRAGGPDDVVILHYALPSPLSAALQAHAGRRVLLHHNITPAALLRPLRPRDGAHLHARPGRAARASPDTSTWRSATASSTAASCEDAGFARTGVLPIYLDFARYRERPNDVLRRLLDDGRTNLLFVGRIAPNKRQDDLVRLASYWKRFIGPDVRLLLVGKLPRRRHYFDALQSLFYEEHFTPWEVLLPGHVSHDDLLAYYASAHVFVSASDHEGFGVPLVESMLMDVPVVAYRTTAVGDTLGDAGIQFADKRLDWMAEAAHAVSRPGPLRTGVLARQRRARARLRAGGGRGDPARAPGLAVSARPELAFVVQRYGASVTGGSESLARALAVRLSRDYAVTVFTSCARDYVTWRNELPAGESVEDGVTVRRFPVEEERDLAAFNRFAESIYDRPHTEDDERRFLREQGPVRAGSRGGARARKGALPGDPVLHVPLLPDGRGAAGRSGARHPGADHPRRAAAALRPVPRGLRAGPRVRVPDAGRGGARAGALRARRTPRPAGRHGHRRGGPVGRRGVPRAARPRTAVRAVRGAGGRRQGLRRPGALLRAVPGPRRRAGRPGPHRNARHGRAARRRRRAISGSSAKTTSARPSRGRLVVVCPSAYESFSISLLDGFAHGVPGLVNARSAVLKEHCLRGQGGLFYEDGLEFVEALLTLQGDDALRRTLGASGRAYVAAEYRWDVVLDRYRRLIAAVAGP